MFLNIDHMLQQQLCHNHNYPSLQLQQMIFTHDRLVTIRSLGLKVLNIGRVTHSRFLLQFFLFLFWEYLLPSLHLYDTFQINYGLFGCIHTH